MRVAVDVSINAFNQAGSGRYATSLLGALQQVAPAEGVTILPLALPTSLYAVNAGTKRKALTLWWEWVYAPFVLPLRCRQQRCDLLHTTIMMPVGPTAVPVVTTLFDAIPLLYPQWYPAIMTRRLQRWLRLGMARAAHVITISESSARDMAALGLARTVPTSVTYLGSFTDDHPPESAGTLPPFADPYILSVGTLEPRKNLLTVLHAYQSLAQQEPETPMLVIAGGQGWMRENIQSVCQGLGIAERVRLTGFVSDEALYGLYRHATMLVYPSLYEGFGIPPLEAMSLGCPVITSNVSSLPEVVGDAGLLVDPTDAAALTAAMQRLLHDPAERERLRTAGHQRATTFSWARCARETIAVYRQTLSERAPV